MSCNLMLFILMLTAPPVDATQSAVQEVIATLPRPDDRTITFQSGLSPLGKSLLKELYFTGSVDTKRIAEKLDGCSVGIAVKF